MFNTIYYLAIFLMFSLNDSNTIENFKNSEDKISISCTYGDYYAVTGYTDNQYGQNYSLPLRICGSKGYGGVSINFVEANTGYGWSRVSHTSDFRQRNRYYVTVSGSTYYFSI